MQFLSQLMNNISTNSDPLNFIGLLATVIVAVYVFKGGLSTSLIRERHDKLIFPLFDLLEPVLYKNYTDDILNIALQIIKQNKNLADGRLLEISYWCSKAPSQHRFMQLCSYIDRMYDKSCRKLGLKTRRMTYRIDRHQYKNRGYLVLYFIIYILWGLAVIAAFFFVFYSVVVVFLILFESANSAGQMIIAILVAFLFVLSARYMEKRP